MTELLPHLDIIPPFVVRYTASIDERLAFDYEVARWCGLGKRTIRRLGTALTWGKFTAETISKFLKGCEVDLICQRDIRWRIVKSFRRNKYFRHLGNAQRRKFEALMAKWEAAKA